MTLKTNFLIIGTLGNEVISLKWSKTELLQNLDRELRFDEAITFEQDVFSKINHLRGLRDVILSGTIRYDSNTSLVYADIQVEGIMIVPCAITNEDIEHPFSTESLEVFSFHKIEKDEDIHEVKGDVVELLPVIFQLIILEVPFKLVKDGIVDYPKGDGWEVVKEEDYRKEKSAIDPRLAKLKDFKIEE